MTPPPGRVAVTEWTQWPSWRRLAAIARAPLSGPAAATGSLAAGSLADLLEALEEYSPHGYPGAVREIADLLLERQTAIAPLVGLVNTVYLGLDQPPAALAAELRDVERRMATSAGLLAVVGAALIENDAIVLTHGESGSVQSVLARAARDRHFLVSCLATMPLEEGIELAADLAAAGLAVEVVPDDQIIEVVSGVDLVVVGANAFGADRIMNTVGWVDLADEAHDAGIPLYVVASVEKALPDPLFARAVGAGIGRFEAVGLDRVTAVVTEMGIFDPWAAGKLASEREVSPLLLERM